MSLHRGIAKEKETTVKTEEDEAWEELEKAQGWRKRQIEEKAQQVERDNIAYELGWNSALEMAAYKLTHEFKAAFGEDTLASVAVYIKGLKK